MSASNNPANFANRPTEEVQAIASKGGQASHGGGGGTSTTADEGQHNRNNANDNPGNFANRPREEVQAIASKGGQASHSGGGGASVTTDENQVCRFLPIDLSTPKVTVLTPKKHNRNNANDNPGNFANRPREEVQAIASKGGQSSHAHNVGFAQMDPEKQREIASKGGRASGRASSDGA
ncbi:MAG: hypothetical protein Q9165_001399 [Trypethelium subeluteriae]